MAKNNNDNQTISNAAKTFLANVRFLSVDNPIKTMVFTSSIPNEGKTFVSRNAALAMATSGKRTLIVEADMRRHSLAQALGVHPKHGLYSVLSREVSFDDAIVQVQPYNLYFMDTEPHIPNPSDLLSSHVFSEFLSHARSRFDYVIFDTPPVGTFVDAAVLGSMVDAVFMVVRERFTRREEFIRSTEQLRTANVPLAGIVMNCCENESRDYYYEYYRNSARGGAGSGGRRSSRKTGKHGK